MNHNSLKYKKFAAGDIVQPPAAQTQVLQTHGSQPQQNQNQWQPPQQQVQQPAQQQVPVKKTMTPAAPAVQKWTPASTTKVITNPYGRDNAAWGDYNRLRDAYWKNYNADPKAERTDLMKKLDNIFQGRSDYSAKMQLENAYRDKRLSLDEMDQAYNTMNFFDKYKQSYADAENAGLAGDINSEWLDEVNQVMPDDTTGIGKAIKAERDMRLAQMAKKGQSPTAAWASGAGSGGDWRPTASGDYLYVTPQGQKYRYSDIMNPNSDYMRLESDIKNAGREGNWGTVKALTAQRNAMFPNFNPKAAKQAWKNQFPDIEMSTEISELAPKIRSRAAGGGQPGEITNWASNWGGFANQPYYQQSSMLEGGNNVYGGVGPDGRMYNVGSGGPLLDASKFQNQNVQRSNPYVRQFAKGGMVGKKNDEDVKKSRDGIALRGKTRGKIL